MVLKLFASLIGTTTFGLVWQKWCKGHFDPPTHHVTHTSTTHGSHNTSICVLPFDCQQLHGAKDFPFSVPLQTFCACYLFMFYHCQTPALNFSCSRKIRCSEIAPEAIFVLRFIFGLNAARIPGLSVFGVLFAMLHGSRSLVGYQMSDVGIAVNWIQEEAAPTPYAYMPPNFKYLLPLLR